MDLGVKLLVRETLFSSMELSRQVLLELGFDRQEADRTITAFHDFDEKLLHQQHAIYRDEQQLIATARQAADELKGLFEAENAQAQSAEGDGQEVAKRLA